VRAEIDLDNLAYNVRQISSLSGGVEKIIAVVKADAYGHGDRYVACQLQEMGVGFFAVSNIDEAVSLRKAGVTGEILVFGPTPFDLCYLLQRYRIIQTVFSESYAVNLSQAAELGGEKIDVHVKLDTGMGRIGFLCQESESLMRIWDIPNLNIKGVYTHFSHADSLSSDAAVYTRRQAELFGEMVRTIESNNLSCGMIHAQNSAALLNHSDMQYDMIRPGIILYGLYPGDCKPLGIKPIMELKAAISMIKTIDAGTAVSYGRSFVADRPTRVATIPIGYADGYPRLLSNRGRVLVGGKFAKIIGNICMDQLMIDVTDIDVGQNDIVTLFGRDGDEYLPVDEIAELSGTINYEIVCLIGRRVPRIYKKGGQIIGMADYIT